MRVTIIKALNNAKNVFWIKTVITAILQAEITPAMNEIMKLRIAQVFYTIPTFSSNFDLN